MLKYFLLLFILFAENLVAAEIVAMQRVSVTGKYLISLTPHINTVSIGQIHSWTLKITPRSSADNQKILGVTVSGGMQVHGHGLPTTPKIEVLQPGQEYSIEGIMFNMMGEWQLFVNFRTSVGTDSAAFSLEIGETVKSSETGWSDAEIAILSSLALPSTNAGDEITNKQTMSSLEVLGQQLFYDSGLSGNNSISCASCHQPDQYFTDGKRLGVGIDLLQRNTPSLIGVSNQRWFYWDGRRDSLWSQALLPLESPREMGNNRLQIVTYVLEKYSAQYIEAFGKPPFLPAGLPSDAGPYGSESWQLEWKRMRPNHRKKINSVFVNIGKSIAAFEGLLQPKISRFDLYVRNLIAGGQSQVKTLLTDEETAGLKLFISEKTQCLNCHNTPYFTNNGFHNLGTAIGLGGEIDYGRFIGVQAALLDEFNCRSQYGDSSNDDCPDLEYVDTESLEGIHRGAFKTPGLRGVEFTAPYLHDGRYETLDEVVNHYFSPPELARNSPNELPKVADLSDAEKSHIVAFLKSLSGVEGQPSDWLYKLPKMDTKLP